MYVDVPIRSDKMIKKENHAGKRRDTEYKKFIQKFLGSSTGLEGLLYEAILII